MQKKLQKFAKKGCKYIVIGIYLYQEVRKDQRKWMTKNYEY